MQNGLSSSPLAITISSWYRGLPLVTKATFTLIVGLYVCQLITGYDNVAALCLSPFFVIHSLQVHRVLTAVLLHAGLLHVTFNMLAFVPMANSLERLVGSVQFLHMLLLFTALEGVIYVAAAYALTLGHVYPGANMSCAVGFSGVIFGLIVVDNAQSNAATRSIFGLFTVPAQLYPWALLVFWQLLMPSVSFLGHLAGVLVGQLWVWNMLRPLALPRTTTVWLEQSRALSTAVRLPSFMMMPGGAGMPYTTHAGGSDAGGAGGSSGAGASGARGGGGGGGGGGGLVKSFAALKGMWRPNGSGAAGGEAAGGDDVEAGAGAAGGSGSRPAVFQGTGRVLGSSSSSSSSGSAAPPALPPSSAAALAAEARMGGGGGGAGGSGGGGGAAGVGRTASSNDRAGPRP